MMPTPTTPLTRRVALWAATAVGAAAMLGGGWSVTQTLAATHPPVRVVASTTQAGTATAAAPGAASGTNAAANNAAGGTAPTFPQPVHDTERDSGD